MNSTTLSIVYVGPLTHGGTCLQRLVALRNLGHAVEAVDTARRQPKLRLFRLIHETATKTYHRLIDSEPSNAAMLALALQKRPDIVWVDKGVLIEGRTLQAILDQVPSVVLISYSPDDMLNVQNQSRQYLSAIKVYHLHVTTKSYNVAELTQKGARSVVFVDNAFAPERHRPIPLSEEERMEFGGPVGFIGYFEEARERSIQCLADSGLHVRVWGHGAWRRTHRCNLRVEQSPLWADDYARAICAFDINLCFLRKANRDRQTTRSIEIPACGAFMLAERTDEHLRLFREGEEAEFFSSDEELVEKVRYYLVHPERRERIAAAGRARCINSGYSNADRIRLILQRYADVVETRGCGATH
jgi:spore maturation protein CgeB